MSSLTGDPGASCPSEFALDRMFAGELDFEHKRSLEVHVAACSQCSGRLRARQAGFGSFPELDARAVWVHVRRASEPVGPPRARWRAFTAALCGAAALTAVALLMRQPAGFEAGADTTRVKGGLALRVYRLRAGRSEEVASGAPFQAGDRLRFRVSTPAPGFVSVLGVEASGTLYTAWPLDGGAARALPASQGLLLDGAVELDAAPGRETLWLVHCKSAARCTPEGASLACPEGCAVTPFSLDKP